MNSLRMSFWVVPSSRSRGHAGLLGGDDVHRPDRRGRRVDRHRRRHAFERQAVEQDLHVGQRAHGDAARPELAFRLGVVGVVAVQRRHVVGDRQAGLAGREQPVEAGVRVLGRPEPGEHPHRPQAASIAGRVDAAGERRIARQADAGLGVLRQRPRPVQPLDGHVADRREARLALGRAAERRIEALGFPGGAARRDVGRLRRRPIGHGADSSTGRRRSRPTRIVATPVTAHRMPRPRPRSSGRAGRW